MISHIENRSRVFVSCKASVNRVHIPRSISLVFAFSNLEGVTICHFDPSPSLSLSLRFPKFYRCETTRGMEHDTRTRKGFLPREKFCLEIRERKKIINSSFIFRNPVINFTPLLKRGKKQMYRNVPSMSPYYHKLPRIVLPGRAYVC